MLLRSGRAVGEEQQEDPALGPIVSPSTTIRPPRLSPCLTVCDLIIALGMYAAHLPHSCSGGSARNPLYSYTDKYIPRYVFQEETGEGGTPHLQGFIHFNQPVALSTIKSWNPRLHLEQTRSVVQSVAYCSDPTKRTGQLWHLGYSVPSQTRPWILKEDQLYDWQRNLAAEMELPANDRSIIWYQDATGGSGKTAMARYILATFGSKALYLSGGCAKDISYQVVKAKEDPCVVLFNLARSQEGKVSYAAMETIKDGLIQSGKYEGGMRMFAPPHVVIFANWAPDIAALSADRWMIRQLHNNRLLGLAI